MLTFLILHTLRGTSRTEGQKSALTCKEEAWVLTYHQAMSLCPCFDLLTFCELWVGYKALGVQCWKS